MKPSLLWLCPLLSGKPQGNTKCSGMGQAGMQDSCRIAPPQSLARHFEDFLALKEPGLHCLPLIPRQPSSSTLLLAAAVISVVRSAKYSTHEQGSPRQSWQPLASRSPVTGTHFLLLIYQFAFSLSESVVFIWTLYHVKPKKNISVCYNSEAFLSSAACHEIMHLIHNIAMRCYFWHFRLSLDKVTCDLQAIKARNNFWFIFDFISK